MSISGITWPAQTKLVKLFDSEHQALIAHQWLQTRCDLGVRQNGFLQMKNIYRFIYAACTSPGSFLVFASPSPSGFLLSLNPVLVLAHTESKPDQTGAFVLNAWSYENLAATIMSTPVNNADYKDTIVPVQLCGVLHLPLSPLPEPEFSFTVVPNAQLVAATPGAMLDRLVMFPATRFLVAKKALEARIPELKQSSALALRTRQACQSSATTLFELQALQRQVDDALLRAFVALPIYYYTEGEEEALEALEAMAIVCDV